jgi:hypothetical protein
MTPSQPCTICGQVDNLETVDPLGVYLDKAILWICRCGNTRAVEISFRAPQELVRKAMIIDEIKDRTKNSSPGVTRTPGTVPIPQ